ncbi:MAG: O-antigen ligase family protein [Clostridiales bacterium]|nr:O-antigen ligase family protein [Clostridiales bacterium]
MDFSLQFFVVLPCLIIYLTKQVKKNKILEIYRKTADIIFVMSFISAVVWFFRAIVPVLPLNTSISIEWGSTHIIEGVFGLFYECQVDDTFGLTFYRNTGIFCEAPMNSLIMSLALIYEMFFRNKISKIRVALLCLFIITTISSTGFIFILAAFVIKYWEIMKNRTRRTKIIYFSIFIIMIPLLALFLNRLFDTKSDISSYMVRLVDYITGVYAFKENPVFGVGYNNITALYVYKSVLMAQYDINTFNTGFSNSITGILGQGGIILTAVYFFPFIQLIVNAKKYKNINYRYFSILLIVLLTFTIFHARYIMIYFIALAYAVFLSSTTAKAGKNNIKVSKK